MTSCHHRTPLHQVLNHELYSSSHESSTGVMHKKSLFLSASTQRPNPSSKHRSIDEIFASSGNARIGALQQLLLSIVEKQLLFIAPFKLNLLPGELHSTLGADQIDHQFLEADNGSSPLIYSIPDNSFIRRRQLDKVPELPGAQAPGTKSIESPLLRVEEEPGNESAKKTGNPFAVLLCFKWHEMKFNRVTLPEYYSVTGASWFQLVFPQWYDSLVHQFIGQFNGLLHCLCLKLRLSMIMSGNPPDNTFRICLTPQGTSHTAKVHSILKALVYFTTSFAYIETVPFFQTIWLAQPLPRAREIQSFALHENLEVHSGNAFSDPLTPVPRRMAIRCHSDASRADQSGTDTSESIAWSWAFVTVVVVAAVGSVVVVTGVDLSSSLSILKISNSALTAARDPFGHRDVVCKTQSSFTLLQTTTVGPGSLAAAAANSLQSLPRSRSVRLMLHLHISTSSAQGLRAIRRARKDGGNRGIREASSSAGTKSSGCSGSGMYTGNGTQTYSDVVHTPLEAFKEHSETIIDSNDDSTSSDDDSYENINYVDASPPDAEIVSLEVVEIVIPEDQFLAPSLPDYKAFYIDNDHFKEKSSGSTTTHVDFFQYDSFIFDLSNDQFPPTDRSNFYHEEFADELAQIISQPEYDCFFKIEPELGNLTMDVVNDIFPTREPRVHVPNVLPTHPTLDTDFILLSEPLFAYIVWIFLPFLTYPVAPPYLLSCGNEDTIFDPGISIYHSFMPGSINPCDGSSIATLNKRFVGGTPCLSILSSFYFANMIARILKPLVLTVFVLRSQELHNSQLHLGIPIS
ncbi:hypothetical protein Tco_1328684 [Tanacetum coccineum]